MKPVNEVVEFIRADIAKAIAYYAANPSEFCRDVIRVEPQKWQNDFMQAVSDARHGKLEKKRFAIRSGTGVGKTAGVAWLNLWHLACFEDSKIVCTAPTAPQIKAVLWPEIRKWIFNIPEELRQIFPYDAQTDRITLLENFSVARTAREESPEAFQGFHAKNIILFADEASGVPDAIYNAGQGVMSSKGALTILIGNPTRPVGWFYDAFHSDSHLYWTMRVGCDQSEMVQPEYITNMRDKHGVESYEYKVRVLGEFHLEDAGIIIPRPWIDESVDRAVEPDTDWIVWGVDISDGGRDKSAIAKRMGNTLLEATKSWGGIEALKFAQIVAEEYYSTPTRWRPQEICCDGIGMGGPFTTRLREMLQGEPVRIVKVMVSGRLGKESLYTSNRVLYWSRGREWFQRADCRIPKDDVLTAQLCGVEWEVNSSNGKWEILDKAVGGKSPDHADAFILTFGGSKGARASLTTKINGVNLGTNNNYGYAIGSASYLQR